MGIYQKLYSTCQSRRATMLHRDAGSGECHLLCASGRHQLAMLPVDFPNWKTVYHYFREWRITWLWQKIHDRLRALCRKKAGRESQPSAAIIDSQSVKVADSAGWSEAIVAKDQGLFETARAGPNARADTMNLSNSSYPPDLATSPQRACN
jgi:transposase